MVLGMHVSSLADVRLEDAPDTQVKEEEEEELLPPPRPNTSAAASSASDKPANSKPAAKPFLPVEDDGDDMGDIPDEEQIR